jgi:L-fuculose-phosphate aldolase
LIIIIDMIFDSKEVIMVKQEWKKKLTEYTYKFYDMGLSPSQDSGDISMRDPETNLIYVDPRPSSTLEIPNWRAIKPEDIIVVDLEGNIVDAGHDRFPTVELPMHLAIYKSRPEVYGIIHSHAIYSSAFAIIGWNIPNALAEQALYIGGETPCAKYAPVGSGELANNITAALGKTHQAALLCSHGAVCVGKDIDEAFRVSEYLEKGAQTVSIALSMGGKPLPLDIDNLVDPNVVLD